MWVMCDCFKYFIFIKGSILHCFHDVFVSGPAQMDLYILTDGALPLPAHSPPRIVANVKLVLFFFFFFLPLCCMYRLHKDLSCCLSTNVDLVISNLWTIFWYTTYFFVAFSLFGRLFRGNLSLVLQQNESSVSFYISCVYIDSILYVYLYPFWFCSHYCTAVSYTLRELFGQPQLSLKKYLCLKGVFVCSHLWLYVYHTVISAHAVVVWWTGSYNKPESENTENTVIIFLTYITLNKV